MDVHTESYFRLFPIWDDYKQSYCEKICEHEISLLQSKYLEMRFQDGIDSEYFKFKGKTTKVLQSSYAILYSR